MEQPEEAAMRGRVGASSLGAAEQVKEPERGRKVGAAELRPDHQTFGTQFIIRIENN